MHRPPIKIAPSLLSADFSRLGEEVARVEDAGADLLHVDVMDGHFVPNLTIGLPVVEALHRVARRPLDVHLMIDNPGDYVARYHEAGAAGVTVHLEVSPDLGPMLERIRATGARPCVAVNPGTSVEPLRDHLGALEMVLVMSVQPGFGGQSFRPEVLPKIEALRSWGYEGDVEVDGGIGLRTIADAARAGANVFVAGTAIFGAPDLRERISQLREAASAVAV